MDKSDKIRLVGDWPTLTEKHWYSLAITSAIFTAVAILTAFTWIFGDGFDQEADPKLAQALAPFGVALFAVVTFCMAGWRGSINTRQADQAEREGRAKLLQEGAKLLSEADKASHVSAGVATLGVLAGGPDEQYAFQAMNLLADYVEDHMSSNHLNRHRAEISGVMQNGDRNGANTGRDITFDCTPNYEDDYVGDEETTYWHFIPGFKKIRYRSGTFAQDVHYQIDELKNVDFSKVQLLNWNAVKIDDRFYRCWFVECGIKSVGSLDSLNLPNDFQYAFQRCDFSGCEIRDIRLLTKDLKKQDNYFSIDNPPKLVGTSDAVEWKDLLHIDAPPDRLGLL